MCWQGLAYVSCLAVGGFCWELTSSWVFVLEDSWPRVWRRMFERRQGLCDLHLDEIADWHLQNLRAVTRRLMQKQDFSLCFALKLYPGLFLWLFLYFTQFNGPLFRLICQNLLFATLFKHRYWPHYARVFHNFIFLREMIIHERWRHCQN